jgi:hypothetical protein
MLTKTAVYLKILAGIELRHRNRATVKEVTKVHEVAVLEVVTCIREQKIEIAWVSQTQRQLCRLRQREDHYFAVLLTMLYQSA